MQLVFFGRPKYQTLPNSREFNDMCSLIFRNPQSAGASEQLIINHFKNKAPTWNNKSLSLSRQHIAVFLLKGPFWLYNPSSYMSHFSFVVYATCE